MTRSEERLIVGSDRIERGRVRIRKVVVTQPQTATVLLGREEARLIREPVSAAEHEALPARRELVEEQHEIVLHADVVVTRKVAVPVERVRVARRTVAEQQQVAATLRQERIELVDDGGTMR